MITTATTCLYTYTELLAIIQALPGFDFLDLMYAPDAAPGYEWSARAFVTIDGRAGTVDGGGDTLEDALYLVWLAHLSNRIRGLSNR